MRGDGTYTHHDRVHAPGALQINACKEADADLRRGSPHRDRHSVTDETREARRSIGRLCTPGVEMLVWVAEAVSVCVAAYVLADIDGGSANARQSFEHREERLDDGMAMMDALRTALLEGGVERRKRCLAIRAEAPSPYYADGPQTSVWEPDIPRRRTIVMVANKVMRTH